MSGDEQLTKGRFGTAQDRRGRKFVVGLNHLSWSFKIAKIGRPQSSISLKSSPPPLSLSLSAHAFRLKNTKLRLDVLPRDTPYPRQDAVESAAAPLARSSSHFAGGRCACTDKRNSSLTLTRIANFLIFLIHRDFPKGYSRFYSLGRPAIHLARCPFQPRRASGKTRFSDDV